MATERLQWLCGQVKEYGTASKQQGSIIPSKSLYWRCGGRCMFTIAHRMQETKKSKKRREM